MSSVIDVDATDWDELVITGELPVLVDVWAPWCGACVQLNPTIEALAEKLYGEITVAKLNADDSRDLVRLLGVRALPTVVLFKDGKELTRVVGGRSEAFFLDLIREHANVDIDVPPGVDRNEMGDSTTLLQLTHQPDGRRPGS